MHKSAKGKIKYNMVHLIKGIASTITRALLVGILIYCATKTCYDSQLFWHALTTDKWVWVFVIVPSHLPETMHLCSDFCFVNHKWITMPPSLITYLYWKEIVI